jgi:hypothetical protein
MLNLIKIWQRFKSIMNITMGVIYCVRLISVSLEFTGWWRARSKRGLTICCLLAWVLSVQNMYLLMPWWMCYPHCHFQVAIMHCSDHTQHTWLKSVYDSSTAVHMHHTPHCSMYSICTNRTQAVCVCGRCFLRWDNTAQYIQHKFLTTPSTAYCLCPSAPQIQPYASVSCSRSYDEANSVSPLLQLL